MVPTKLNSTSFAVLKSSTDVRFTTVVHVDGYGRLTQSVERFPPILTAVAFALRFLSPFFSAGVAQLAFLGYVTTEFGYRLPGAISLDGTTFESIPSGFAALSAMPTAGLVQIIAFAGWLEFKGWKQNPDSFPGDYSASSFPVGFLDSVAKTPEQELKLRAQELNQGRAAMMG